MSPSAERRLFTMPARFLLLHGAADVGWSFHRVARELEARGHVVAAPDLPCEDEAASWSDYAGAALDALATLGLPDLPLVVLGHSLGGFTAPIVAERADAAALVFLTAMVPRPGEPACEWWSATGYPESTDAKGADEVDTFLHDVEPGLAAEASRRGRGQAGGAMQDPYPLAALPAIPTTFLLCRDDRFFPAAWMRGVVEERLGLEPVEIPGGHCAPLSYPAELAEALDAVARQSLPSDSNR